MQEISQISTIKRANFRNQCSELKYSRASIRHEENSEINTIQNFLTSIGKKNYPQTPKREYSDGLKLNRSHMNQRKLNTSLTSEKNNSFLCKSIIHTVDANFAIQSQPNSMIVGMSAYFGNNDMQYDQRVKSLTDQQEFGMRKLNKFLAKFDPITYVKKEFFQKVKQISIIKHEAYLKSFQKRQYHFIQLLQDSKDQMYRHQKVHNNIKISYHNKLIGLYNPSAIQNQRFKIIERNFQKLKQRQEKSLEKQQSRLSKSVNQSGFAFNFEIHPRPPKHFESRIQSNDFSVIKRIL